MPGNFRSCCGESGAGSILEPIRAAIFAVMPADNILVLVVDGLRASALGAYGNTTFPTPVLDQFAAESFLLDSCFADSTEISPIYRAFWRSLHPLRPDAIARDSPSLPRRLAGSGYQTTLITDDADIVVILLPATSTNASNWTARQRSGSKKHPILVSHGFLRRRLKRFNCWE